MRPHKGTVVAFTRDRTRLGRRVGLAERGVVSSHCLFGKEKMARVCENRVYETAMDDRLRLGRKVHEER